MNPTVSNTKIIQIENKIPDNSKYITTQQFNTLTAEKFKAKLMQAGLVNKTDLDNKLTSCNTRITSITTTATTTTKI